MPPLEHDPVADQKAADVASAVIRARNHNASRCACSLALFAATIAEPDPTARTSLALTMLALARELDPDLVDLRKWN